MYRYCDDIEKAFRILTQSNDAFHSIVDMRGYMRYLHSNTRFISAVLSENEYLKLQQFHYPKKKLQWLCGRIAAKESLARYLETQSMITDVKKIEVLYGEGGYPYLKNFEYLKLTITHSFPYCAALISHHPVGIDIEKIFASTSGIEKFFFSDNEKKLLEAADPSEQKRLACCIWTRKEALSKLIKKGLAIGYKALDTSLNEVFFMNYKVGLKSWICKDYCVSLAVGDKADE